jgi:regulator of chromosome condensation
MGASKRPLHESPIAWRMPSNYKSVVDAPNTRPKCGVKDQPSPSPAAPLDNLPTLGGHERNEDGSLTGFVFGSKIYRDGESIVTSAVAQALDDQVVTESGSAYLLGVAAPQLPAPPLGPTTIAVVGNGDCGQLGFGPDLLEAEKPKRCPFFEGKRIVSVACGGMHTAAVGVDGLVWTWGCNDDGALGRAGDEDVPQLVAGGALASARVTAVACGDSVRVAIGEKGG